MRTALFSAFFWQEVPAIGFDLGPLLAWLWKPFVLTAIVALVFLFLDRRKARKQT